MVIAFVGKAESLPENTTESKTKSEMPVSDKLWISGYKDFIHNSNCSYYNRGEGHFQKDSTDGKIDCKICGGRNPIPIEKTEPTKLSGVVKTKYDTQTVKKEVNSEQENDQVSRTSGVYWMTSSTGVIHNSSCRYYKNSDGSLTDGKSGGRDCKICGGTGTKSILDSNIEERTSGPQGQAIQTGPRGGRYYINKNGNKTYLRRK